MMRFKILVINLLVIAVWQSAFAYDFSAVAPSGHTLYYNIVNGEAQVAPQNPADRSLSYGPFYTNNLPTGNIIIPESVVYNGTTYAVTSIGYCAFQNCTTLTSVVIPNSVTSIGDFAFEYDYNLHSVTIPNSVTSIGYRAFGQCGFTSIIIPNSVTNIGGSAFENCSLLSSVTIGNSVTCIDYAAFWLCRSLASITVLAENPPTLGPSSDASDRVFRLVSCTQLVVPCGTGEAYRNSSWNLWFNNFSEVMTYDFAAVPDDVAHGRVDTLALPTCAQPTVSFSATAQPGYRFNRWSDGSCENPRTINLVSDTALIAHFESVVYDTVYVHDTTVVRDTIVVHDTTVVHDTMIAYLVHIADTALVTRYIYDSTTVNNTYYDTFYVFTHAVDTMRILDTVIVNHFQYDTVIRNVYQYDTTIVNNFQYDTSIYNSFRFDTTLVFDTMIVNVYNFDTSIYNNYQFDTVVFNTYRYDTTLVNIYDTTIVNIYDTTISNRYQYDTVIINHTQYDTVIVNLTQSDTVTINNYFYDTVIVSHYYHDTVLVNNYIYDTIYLNRYIFDTVYIHDTVYVTDQQGIDDAVAVDAKIYQRGGRVVVEGAEGHEVVLYDAVGRQLATRRDEGQPLAFEVPASGAYLVRIGQAPARRIVVVR